MANVSHYAVLIPFKNSECAFVPVSHSFEIRVYSVLAFLKRHIFCLWPCSKYDKMGGILLNNERSW